MLSHKNKRNEWAALKIFMINGRNGNNKNNNKAKALEVLSSVVFLRLLIPDMLVFEYKDVFWSAIELILPLHVSSGGRFLSRATKIILHKTLMRPVVTYGAETWTMTKKEEKAVLIFERKIFRRIYGAKYENGEWKTRTNRELEEMSKGENVVKWIKGQRIS
jgi:hypothetical protein